jgi:hypothetical protein
MMEGITKTKETVDTSDDREIKAASLSDLKSLDIMTPKAAATTTANADTVGKTSTSGKKVKPEKREKRPYHYRTKKPRDMPKRPLSAYNYFFRSERGKFVAEQAEKEAAGAEITVPDATLAEEQGREKAKSSLFATMGKTIAKRWKEIVPEDLEEYKALAAVDSKRYRAEMDEYHAGRARRAPPKKERKDSPISKEAGLPASQPAAPSFLEGISGFSSSLPSRGGISAAQLQQQQKQQTTFDHDPYLDQLLRLQQAQQGNAPPQQLYGSPTMGSINAGGGSSGVDISALQTQILDAQLSRAMQQQHQQQQQQQHQQQQQQQHQRATLGLDMFSAASGGQYASEMASQGHYGGGGSQNRYQAMIDDALYQRASQGMHQTPGHSATSQLQGNITQGGGGYDSFYQAGGSGSEQQQQQLLLQQLMQQQFGAAQQQQQPQQYSTMSAMDPQVSSGDMARLMLQQQQQMASLQQAPNDVEDRDMSGGGDSAGERW